MLASRVNLRTMLDQRCGDVLVPLLCSEMKWGQSRGVLKVRILALGK